MTLAANVWAPAQSGRAGARLGLAVAASLAMHVALAERFDFAPAAWSEVRAASAVMRARLLGREDTVDAPASAGETLAQADAGTPALSGHTYFAASDLERRPALAAPISPEYPAEAPAGGGYLVLKLLINEIGTVDRVAVLVSDPEGAFDQAAVSTFGGARFTPGMRHGVPVKSQMTIELKYHAEPGRRAAL